MPHRKWTEREIAYLEKFYEKRGVPYIAQKLDRSQDSVKWMAGQLGLNAYLCEDLYLKTVAKCFSVDSKTVNRWIENHGLKCKRVQRGQLTFTLIEVKNFWAWAKNHKDLIPWEKYERLSILPEPEWIQEIYEKKEHHRVRMWGKKITSSDKFIVLRMMERGNTFIEIAAALERTPDSVEHIYYLARREENERNGIAHRRHHRTTDKSQGQDEVLPDQSGN